MFLEKTNFVLDDKSDLGFSLSNLEFYSLNDEYRQSLIEFERNNIEPNTEVLEVLELNEDSKETEFINKDDVHTVKILVTQACNMSCRYCYASGGNYNEKTSVMSKEMAKEVGETLKNFKKLKNVCFFGGEPLLNIQAIKIIAEELANMGKEINFYSQTNGTVISSEIVDTLLKYDIDLTISIDGPKDINDTNRVFNSGEGSFDIIDKNIKRFINSGVEISSIESTLTLNTINKISRKQIKKYFFNKYNIKNIAVFEDVTLDDVILENENFLDNIEGLKKDKIFFSEVYSKILNRILTRTKSTYFCEAGRYQITINTNGEVYPCQLYIPDKDLRFGHIRSFEEKKLPKGIIANDKSQYNSCNKCLAKNICTKCKAILRDKNNTLELRECEDFRLKVLELVDVLFDMINVNKYEEFADIYSKSQSFIL